MMQLCLFVKANVYFAFSCKTIKRGLTPFLSKDHLLIQCHNMTVGSCLVINSLHGRCHYFTYTTLSMSFLFCCLFLGCFFFLNIAINQHSIKALVINSLSSNHKGIQV